MEFEEMEGNGYCADSNGNHDVAQTLYMSMPHEEARKICRLDDQCVGYSYSLNNLLRDDGIYHNVIMYTNSSCTTNCGNDAWQTNADLITQTINNGQWDDGKCYVKRDYYYYLDKCITNL